MWKVQMSLKLQRAESGLVQHAPLVTWHFLISSQGWVLCVDLYQRQTIASLKPKWIFYEVKNFI